MLEKKQILDDNSPEKCAKFCQPESGSYWYFALQYGKYCYCGNSLQHQTKKPEKDCWTTCPGDQLMKCGGSYRNSLYRFTNLKHVGQLKDLISQNTHAIAQSAYHFYFHFPDCKDGYHIASGSMQESDHIGTFTCIVNTETCGKRCEDTDGCKSYEYSSIEKTCNLTTESKPTHDSVEGHTFCSTDKGKKSLMSNIFCQTKVTNSF